MGCIVLLFVDIDVDILRGHVCACSTHKLSRQDYAACIFILCGSALIGLSIEEEKDADWEFNALIDRFSTGRFALLSLSWLLSWLPWSVATMTSNDPLKPPIRHHIRYSERHRARNSTCEAPRRKVALRARGGLFKALGSVYGFRILPNASSTVLISASASLPCPPCVPCVPCLWLHSTALT